MTSTNFKLSINNRYHVLLVGDVLEIIVNVCTLDTSGFSKLIFLEKKNGTRRKK